MQDAKRTVNSISSAATVDIRVYELSGSDHRNCQLSGYFKQVFVTADNDLGTNRKSASNELVIMRIAAYRLSQLLRLHDQRLRHEDTKEPLEIGVDRF